ncbi:MAG: phospholipase [Actinomycetota bacterium]|jgi:phospholipase C
MTISRRRFLRGAGLVGGAAAFAGMSASTRAALAAVAAPGSTLRDIEHIVILCQENRSFDHYFGTLSGVAGFSDPAVKPDPVTGRTVFEQFDPNPLNQVGATMLPWRVHPSASAAQCMADVDHSWQGQHVSLAQGTNAAFVTTHTGADLVSDQDPTVGGARTMSYFTRAELPFHYGLADAFTICDRYFCSVLGPTTANRLYLMSATLDHEGAHGGPEINNLKYPNANFSWMTYPERLQAAGVDWWVYREADDYEDNVLDYFVQYQDTHTELYRRGRSVIPTGQTAAKIRADVQSGNLPQVSWIIQNKANSEHPEAMPAQGAVFMQGILEALTSNPAVWAKTAFIITYDENGGFFDHVVPPTPPPNTPGEYLTPSGVAAAPEALPFPGPIGLGFRVPTLVISPFSRGGYVCTETFDHTSTLRLLEKRFGVEVPNLSAWRRQTVGDLTSAFNFGCASDLSLPKLPDAVELFHAARDQCATLPKISGWTDQHMPVQEAGTRPHPAACVAAATSAPDPVRGEILARTGGPTLPLAAVAGAAAATAVLRRRVVRDA